MKIKPFFLQHGASRREFSRDEAERKRGSSWASSWQGRISRKWAWNRQYLWRQESARSWRIRQPTSPRFGRHGLLSRRRVVHYEYEYLPRLVDCYRSKELSIICYHASEYNHNPTMDQSTITLHPNRRRGAPTASIVTLGSVGTRYDERSTTV